MSEGHILNCCLRENVWNLTLWEVILKLVFVHRNNLSSYLKSSILEFGRETASFLKGLGQLET